MREIFITNLTDLPTVALEVLQYAGNRKKWMLHGEMGVGKTTFVRALCAAIGTNDVASSPTYSLVNEYAFITEDGHSDTVCHLDLYRLHDIDEALDMGIETYLDNDHLCIIEWPELIAAIWPDDVLLIYLSMTENGKRKIVFL